MRKRIFLLPLIAIGFGLQAQSIGNSPYAAFGIGEVKYDNSVETSAMGGINTAYIWDFNNSFNFKINIFWNILCVKSNACNAFFFCNKKANIRMRCRNVRIIGMYHQRDAKGAKFSTC